MSEENENSQEGWSGIKKAIIGAITTALTAGGAWFATHLPGGEDKEEAKTEQASPAAAPVEINVQQNQENKQQTKNSAGGSPQVIRERVIEKQAPAAESAPKKQDKDEEDPW